MELDRFGPPDVMRWATRPLPEREADQVEIAVEAVGVNFADTMVRRGEYRRDQPLSFVPGFEVAGRVVDGPWDGPPRGSMVVALTESGGGYADRVLVPRNRVLRVRDGVGAVDAAAIFTQGVTAWYSVHRFGRVRSGDAVLIHAAAGGLGGLCVQLVAEIGGVPIATASTSAKLEIARAYGAAETLIADPATLADDVRRLTGGAGVRSVIDGVGGSLFGPSMRALGFGGTYVVAGAASQEPAVIDVRALMPRGQTVVGVLVARVSEEDPREPQQAFDELQTRLLDGRLKPDVKVLEPDKIVWVHEQIESRALTGKVVLAPI